MAVDTATLISPHISEQVAAIFENESFMRMGVDVKHDIILYQFTSAELRGSFDNRIMIKVKRERFVNDSRKEGLSRAPKIVPCEPYLEVECSLHKLFLGHNIYGGTEDFQGAVLYLIDLIEQSFDCKLPEYQKWLVKRVDYAAVFNLDSFEAVSEYFYMMRNGYYPRRDVSNYGMSGVYVKGRTTALKMYHKGPEFRAHDFKKLKHIFPENYLFSLLEFGNTVLRCEVEIKSKKLKYDFEHLRLGHEPYVSDITSEYLRNVYSNEMHRFLKEGKKSSDKVRDAVSVSNRLRDMYKPATASKLLGTWYQIAELGLERFRMTVTRASYYRQLKQLTEAGIAWNHTDMLEDEHTSLLVPLDFQPLLDDLRRMADVDPAVTELINECKHRRLLPFDSMEYIFEKEKKPLKQTAT